ncbi:Detected protein of confused Function [Hibiscus syriacus]|uniref:Detected protein of confused Function n=1 Tax=Hibiscus syriacus TaxID=106335 RepID=A0A6A3C4K5_HIBSY|nr:Detected protein of confused Function [Hibiscus syriacus]
MCKLFVTQFSQATTFSWSCVHGSNNVDPFRQGRVHRHQVSRPKSTISGLRTRDDKRSEASNVRHEFMDGQVQASCNIVSSISSCLTSTQFCDAKHRILESQDPKQLVSIFVFDIETTGFCRETGRIIEFAIRDLLGGKNNCLHTLINPDRHVPNSHIHDISTAMDERRSQRIPGSPCLLIAHNARCFDVPLMKEFTRCSMDIPYNYWFFDNGPLGREWMKLNGSRQYSLQALIEMKVTVADILEKSFKVSDVINLVETKEKG